MKIKYSCFCIISLLLCLVLSGCSDYEKQLINGYYLIGIDGKDYMAIQKKMGVVVDYTVFAVGYDDNFIIAKQHPNETYEHLKNCFKKETPNLT
jgi:hypothetical protein